MTFNLKAIGVILAVILVTPQAWSELYGPEEDKVPDADGKTIAGIREDCKYCTKNLPNMLMISEATREERARRIAAELPQVTKEIPAGATQAVPEVDHKPEGR